MSTYSEIKNIPENLRAHRDRLDKLLKDYAINSITEFKHVYKTDEQFQSEWKQIWTDIVKTNGGKLSLSTIGLIIGSVLGGAGIAAMGGAIGVSLAFVFSLSGFIAGSKFDDTKILADEKTVSATLPNEIVDRLKSDADKIGCSTNELIEILIKQVYKID